MILFTQRGLCHAADRLQPKEEEIGEINHSDRKKEVLWQTRPGDD